MFVAKSRASCSSYSFQGTARRFYAVSKPQVKLPVDAKVFLAPKQSVKVSEIFPKDKKIVLFAVPGAFTPTCTLKHVSNGERGKEDGEGEERRRDRERGRARRQRQEKVKPDPKSKIKKF